MTIKIDTEQLRADFEAWMRKRKPDISLKRYADGRYRVTTMNYAWEGYQAGRAALQSQATEAFPCRIIEGDFEAGTVTLEMQGDYTVSSGQKYLCDAPLQSQDAEDALTDAIQKAIDLLGPEAPICSGCEYEWNHALRVLRAAIDHARRVEENK